MTTPAPSVPSAPLRRSDLAVRLVLGAVGVGVGGYGLLLLLDLGFDNLVATLEWVVGGIVVHDAVLAPVTIVVGVLVAAARRRAGAAAGPLTAPLVVAGVVLGTLTVVAVPMLLSLGAKADNPTLLDRDYVAGWFIAAAVCLGAGVAAGIMGGAAARRRRDRGEGG